MAHRFGKCVLCKEPIDREHPESAYDVNPETFRRGWMHVFCFRNALEDIEQEIASNPTLYANRLDEYNVRFG